jgi:hypothetical protein
MAKTHLIIDGDKAFSKMLEKMAGNHAADLRARRIIRVRLTANAGSMKKGEIGYLEITEVSRFGDCLSANFHPIDKSGETTGYGQILHPRFESATEAV